MDEDRFGVHMSDYEYAVHCRIMATRARYENDYFKEQAAYFIKAGNAAFERLEYARASRLFGHAIALDPDSMYRD
jgi:hypothetical protein